MFLMNDISRDYYWGREGEELLLSFILEEKGESTRGKLKLNLVWNSAETMQAHIMVLVNFGSLELQRMSQAQFCLTTIHKKPPFLYCFLWLFSGTPLRSTIPTAYAWRNGPMISCSSTNFNPFAALLVKLSSTVVYPKAHSYWTLQFWICRVA